MFKRLWKLALLVPITGCGSHAYTCFLDSKRGESAYQASQSLENLNLQKDITFYPTKPHVEDTGALTRA